MVTNRLCPLIVIGVLWSVTVGMVRDADAQAAAPRQTSADDYTRYELLEPGSGSFRILYDVSATAPGATHYCNSVRSGSTVSDIAVTDRMTGKPLPFEVVSGDGVRPCGIRPSDPAHEYIRIRLPRPIARDGEIRLLIAKTYADTTSYSATADRVVFERSLGIDRNAVVLPPGYELISVNYPSQVRTEPDGRIMVSFIDIGPAAVPFRIVGRRLP